MLIAWCNTQTKVFREFVRPRLHKTGIKFIARDAMPVEVNNDDVVLTFGAARLKEMQKASLGHKGRAVASQRGHILGSGMGDRWLVTYDAAMTELEWERRTDIDYDIRLAKRLHETGSLLPDLPEYTKVNSFGPLIKEIKKLYETTGKRVPVEIDTETVGTDYLNPDAYIVAVSVSIQAGHAFIRYYPTGKLTKACKADIKSLQWLCNADETRVYGANFKYDMLWLCEKWGIETFNSFVLDTTLVGSLLDENRSNSLNTHAKVYTQMGGYDDCVTPDTEVLMADLSYRAIGDVVPGDELLAFDEEAPKHKHRRRFRRAKAESTKRLVKPCVEVTLSTGQVIKCSDDHGFLAHRYKNNGPFTWVRAHEFRPGCRVKVGAPYEKPVTSYEAGWLSGYFDGEGYVSFSDKKQNGLCSGHSQKPGPVWDHALAIAESLGVSGYRASQKNPDGVLTAKYTSWPTLQLLMKTRPLRLIANAKWEDSYLLTEPKEHKATVLSVVSIGEREVVSLQTSTYTFIAEGLCSHNSFNNKYDKSRMDLVPEPELVQYAGGDADAGLRVALHLRKNLMPQKRLRRFYTELLHPAQHAVRKMEQRGMVIDPDEYIRLDEEVSQQMNDDLVTMIDCLPTYLKHRYMHDLRPTRPKIAFDFLFSYRGLNINPHMVTDKTKMPSMSAEHLQMFEDHPDAGPFIKAMISYTRGSKIKSTYIDGFMAHVRSDGRFHPSYMLFRGKFHGDDQKDVDSGGRTGRTSCKEPAYQCQPEYSRILTRDGYRTMHQIHRALKQNEIVEVLSHTGKWRKAYAPYDNGVQAVFRVFLQDGKYVDATANHKFQLSSGEWSELRYLNTDDRLRVTDANLPEFDQRAIRAADRPVPRWPNLARAMAVPVRLWNAVYGAGGQPEIGEHDKLRLQVGRGQVQARTSFCEPWATNENLSVVGRHEVSMLEPQCQGIPVLRRAWNNCLRTVDGIREFLVRHGGDTTGVLDRTTRSQRRLRTGQLHMDSSRRSEQEQAQFQVSPIVRIQPIGELQTFGIAVENTHSYVTEGVVSHNTIPKHTIWAKPLRRVYVPPPGYVILNVDFSQGELRITACIANEPTMIETYKQGIDMHLKTGAQLNGIELALAMEMMAAGDPLIGKIRQGGKAGNFGLIYGMGAEGFVDYALKSYGVVLTLREAGTFIATFFGLYSRLLDWHEETKQFAHKHKYIESPLGRIRRVPLINSFSNEVRSRQERQAINAGVQATLTDMGLLAMAELDKAYPDLWQFGFTHDAVSFYVREDEVEEQAIRIKQVMENLPLDKFDWTPQLDFPVDIELGECNLADVHKFVV